MPLSEEFHTIIKNGKSLSEIKEYYEINKLKIGIYGDINATFCMTCKGGKLEIAKWLLETNPDIDICAYSNYSFSWSCRQGYLEVAKWLLEIKPDIDISLEDNFSFRSTCDKGHLEISKWLLEIKPDIDICANNNNIFRNACIKGNVKIAKWLYELNPQRYCLKIENDKIVEYSVIIIITNTISKSKLKKKIEKCIICQDLNSNIYTSCGHFYCDDCITKWVQKNNSCPYCRNKLYDNDLLRIVENIL